MGIRRNAYEPTRFFQTSPPRVAVILAQTQDDVNLVLSRPDINGKRILQNPLRDIRRGVMFTRRSLDIPPAHPYFNMRQSRDVNTRRFCQATKFDSPRPVLPWSRLTDRTVYLERSRCHSVGVLELMRYLHVLCVPPQPSATIFMWPIWYETRVLCQDSL